MPVNHLWGHNQGTSSRQSGPDHPSAAIGSGEDEGHMSSDGDTYQDLPEASSSSSSSKFKYSPRGRRYNFDPAAVPWWNEEVVEVAPTPNTRDNRSGRREQEPGELPLKRPNLFIPETTGAFEVGRRKRIGMFSVLPFQQHGTNTLLLYSASLRSSNILLPISWDSLWLCSHQTSLDQRRCIPGSLHAKRTRPMGFRMLRTGNSVFPSTPTPSRQRANYNPV